MPTDPPSVFCEDVACQKWWAESGERGVVILESKGRTLGLNRALQDPSCLEKAHELLSQGTCEDVAQASDAFDRRFDSDQLAALGHLIQHQRHPCFVFDTERQVVVANTQADALLGARPGLRLKDLAIGGVDKSAIRMHLKELFQQPGVAQEPRVMQIHSMRQMRGYSVVLKPPKLDQKIEPYVIVHVVDGVDPSVFLRHLAEVYPVTTSEYAVLSQFMAGQTLEQIAVSRRRSTATVKKQFYALMAKFKVKSQSELLQHLFTLSTTYEGADHGHTPSDHPNRQEAKVLRPNGRVVEVVLAGDMLGKPVVMVPTLFQRCFPANVEQQLKDAGILLILIVPPGRGMTSRPTSDMSERDCFVEDIIAVLDQLSIDRAILFGTDDILRLAVLLTGAVPDRFAHILVTAPVIPISYEKAAQHKDNFIPLSKKMQLLNPALKKLSLALFWQSLTLLHAKGMLRVFFRKDAADLRRCLEPDTLSEIRAAFDSAIIAGFETGANHHLSTFDDWENQIKACPVPITIYEGSESRLCDRAALKRLVQDYSDAITLVEFETAGTSFPYVRPDLMIEMLKACPLSAEKGG